MELDHYLIYEPDEAFSEAQGTVAEVNDATVEHNKREDEKDNIIEGDQEVVLLEVLSSAESLPYPAFSVAWGTPTDATYSEHFETTSKTKSGPSNCF